MAETSRLALSVLKATGLYSDEALARIAAQREANPGMGLAEAAVKFGGVRERMHAARTAARGEEWDRAIYSRLDGAGSPEELAAREVEIRREAARAAASIRRRKGWL